MHVGFSSKAGGSLHASRQTVQGVAACLHIAVERRHCIYHEGCTVVPHKFKEPSCCSQELVCLSSASNCCSTTLNKPGTQAEPWCTDLENCIAAGSSSGVGTKNGRPGHLPECHRLQDRAQLENSVVGADTCRFAEHDILPCKCDCPASQLGISLHWVTRWFSRCRSWGRSLCWSRLWYRHRFAIIADMLSCSV
jgi:hypothetical protein